MTNRLDNKEIDNFQFFFFGKYSRIYLVASIIEVVGIVNFMGMRLLYRN